MTRLHGKANQVADRLFYRLGYCVAGHPKRTLVISLVLVIACCFGFTNFETENNGESFDLARSFKVLEVEVTAENQLRTSK